MRKILLALSILIFAQNGFCEWKRLGTVDKLSAGKISTQNCLYRLVFSDGVSLHRVLLTDTNTYALSSRGLIAAASEEDLDDYVYRSQHGGESNTTVLGVFADQESLTIAEQRSANKDFRNMVWAVNFGTLPSQSSVSFGFYGAQLTTSFLKPNLYTIEQNCA